MPNGFVLQEPSEVSEVEISRGTTKGQFTSVVKYRSEIVASISWYHQNKILAFLMYDASIHIYSSAQEAIDDIVLQTLKQRLKGEL